MLELYTVSYDRDLGGVDSVADKALTEWLSHANDRCGASVEEALKRHQGLIYQAVAHQADRLYGLGPKIAELKDPRAALERPDEETAHRGEELRGRGDDDVDAADEECGDRGGKHVAHIVQGSSHEAGVWRDVAPDTDDAHAVDDFRLPEFVAVVGINSAQWKVGRCRYDGYFATVAGPFTAMLECARRGRVYFRWEVVR